MITINNTTLSKKILKGQKGFKTAIEYHVRPLGPLDPRPIITMNPSLLKSHLNDYYNIKIPGMQKLLNIVERYNKDNIELDHAYDNPPKGSEWVNHPLMEFPKELGKILLTPELLGNVIKSFIE